jgi:hypothetical protein
VLAQPARLDVLGDGEGVEVGDEEEVLVVVLLLGPGVDRTGVVADVELARRRDA